MRPSSVSTPAGTTGGDRRGTLRLVRGPQLAAPRGRALPVATLAEPCGVRAMAGQALDAAGVEWTEIFVGGGVAAVVAAVTAGLGVAALAPRMLPLGAVEVGTGSGFPRCRACRSSSTRGWRRSAPGRPRHPLRRVPQRREGVADDPQVSGPVRVARRGPWFSANDRIRPASASEPAGTRALPFLHKYCRPPNKKYKILLSQLLGLDFTRERPHRLNRFCFARSTTASPARSSPPGPPRG